MAGKIERAIFFVSCNVSDGKSRITEMDVGKKKMVF